jgi:hypothetical protein
MANLKLIDIYCRQNKDIKEYMDIFIETDLGILKHNITSLDFTECKELKEMNRLEKIDEFRLKYGDLYIIEARITYDNDMYILISGKFILIIEYVLNSYFTNSIQEFRIIENINDLNKREFDCFKELDIATVGNG